MLRQGNPYVFLKSVGPEVEQLYLLCPYWSYTVFSYPIGRKKSGVSRRKLCLFGPYCLLPGKNSVIFEFEPLAPIGVRNKLIKNYFDFAHVTF